MSKTKFGTVLVFKDGVSRSEATAALENLRSLLQEDYWVDFPLVYDEVHPDLVRQDFQAEPTREPFVLQEFNPDHGGPVWYIP